MNIQRLVPVAVLCLTFSLAAREKTDVIVMNNGDRMTCEVKGLDGGVLYASFDYIDGTAQVDWSKVSRVESNQLFVVKTVDGTVYTGKLRTPETAGGQPLSIQVLESSEQKTVIEQRRIVEMIATSDKFWQRFNGEVGFGVMYSKGNQSTEYSLNSETAYVRDRWNAAASLDSTLSSSSGTSASARNSLALRYLHLAPWKNWFYSGLGGFLQSSEQQIALQSTVGAGVGRYLKNTNRTSFAVLGGVAFQNIKYEQSVPVVSKNNLAAGLIYAELRLFRFSRANLDATASLFPVITDPGRFRLDTNSTYYVKIFRNLKWSFSFYGNWDNRPPHGLTGVDYGTSSGVSWTFGLK